MRTVLVGVILFLSSVKLFAQYPKWIIQFTDKNNSPYSLNQPIAYLSQKAIDRRTKQQIPIDSSDLPVNSSYIQQVLAKGNVTYLSQAKWMNQILIYCTDNATIDAINQLPFVKKTQAIGLLVSTHKEEKPKEPIQKLNKSSFTNTTTGDTLDYGNSYNQVHIHDGEFLHNKGFTGDGITIAILDGGFYHYKELGAFDSIRLQNRLLGINDFVDYDNSVDEDDAHGMYCLSTIAANIPGVMVGTAPNASFWLLRTENVSSEYPIEEHNWAAAAAFVDSAGADMISSSLGYYYFDDPSFNHSYNDFYANNTTVSIAAEMAAKKGMIVTNSAGNEGSKTWKYLVFPADADSICAVGAVNNDSVIASFSSYGYPGKIKPNVVSVGAGTVIMGTNNVPVTGNGTSFSNPNINGLIACLWQAFPEFNNMTILNAVYESADKFTNPDNRLWIWNTEYEKSIYYFKEKTKHRIIRQ
jgi:subtilisin family serine protease